MCGRAGTRAGDPASKEGACAAGREAGVWSDKLRTPNNHCTLPTQGGESAASVRAGARNERRVKRGEMRASERSDREGI